MRINQRHGLSIKIGDLQRFNVILIAIVLRGICFDETTKFGIFELLLNAGVETNNIQIIIARSVLEASSGSGVIKPNITGLSIRLTLLCVPCIIHSDSGRERVVAPPTMVHKLLLIILHCQIFFVLGASDGKRGRTTDIAGDNAAADNILCVYNIDRSYRFSYLVIIHRSQANMKFNQGTSATRCSSKPQDGRAKWTNSRVIKMRYLRTFKETIEQDLNGVNPALATIGDDVCVGSIHRLFNGKRTSAESIEADANSNHQSVHNPGKKITAFRTKIFRASESAVEKPRSSSFLDKARSHHPEPPTWRGPLQHKQAIVGVLCGSLSLGIVPLQT